MVTDNISILLSFFFKKRTRETVESHDVHKNLTFLAYNG